MVLLGIDWGARRTGLAVTDASWMLASPLAVIDTKKELMKLSEIVQTSGARRIIMGVPFSLSTGEVKKDWGGFSFFERLKPLVSCPFSWVDETGTTHESYTRLSVEGMRFKKKRESVDKVAASLILESFIQERKRRKNTVIAISGNLGTGKSFVAQKMASLCNGFFLSADDISRSLTAPDAAGALAVRELFGERFFSPDGILDRKKLGEEVFSSPDKLNRLNNALHPLIRQTMTELIQQKTESLIFAEIPLFAENKLYYLADFSLLTKSSADVIITRVKERDRRSVEEIHHILKQQAPPRDVESLFDCAVDTSHGWDSYKEEVEQFLNEIISYHREIMSKGM